MYSKILLCQPNLCSGRNVKRGLRATAPAAHGQTPLAMDDARLKNLPALVFKKSMLHAAYKGTCGLDASLARPALTGFLGISLQLMVTSLRRREVAFKDTAARFLLRCFICIVYSRAYWMLSAVQRVFHKSCRLRWQMKKKRSQEDDATLPGTEWRSFDKTNHRATGESFYRTDGIDGSLQVRKCGRNAGEFSRLALFGLLSTLRLSVHR